MGPLPLEVPDAPRLYASLVWGTLERSRDEAQVACLEEQVRAKEAACPVLH